MSFNKNPSIGIEPMQTLTKKPMKLPPRNAMVQLARRFDGGSRGVRSGAVGGPVVLLDGRADERRLGGRRHRGVFAGAPADGHAPGVGQDGRAGAVVALHACEHRRRHTRRQVQRPLVRGQRLLPFAQGPGPRAGEEVGDLGGGGPVVVECPPAPAVLVPEVTDVGDVVAA